MKFKVVEFTLKRVVVSDLSFDVLSKRTGEKLFKVYTVTFELRTYADGPYPLVTTVRYSRYRNGKLRANAAICEDSAMELYMVDKLREILDEIGDTDITEAFLRTVEQERNTFLGD